MGRSVVPRHTAGIRRWSGVSELSKAAMQRLAHQRSTQSVPGGVLSTHAVKKGMPPKFAA